MTVVWLRNLRLKPQVALRFRSEGEENPNKGVPHPQGYAALSAQCKRAAGEEKATSFEAPWKGNPTGRLWDQRARSNNTVLEQREFVGSLR